ncbi:unnamed protein product, partial [Laminaria digitata]
FTLLPICTHDTKHITVDKRVLKGLLKRVGGEGGEDPDFLTGDTSERYWQMYFYVKKSETKNRKFSYTSVKTDGKGVSVVLKREGAVAGVGVRVRGGRRASAPGGAHVPLDLGGKRVVAVDPGASYLATCLSHREDGSEVTWSYSNKEWKAKMGVPREQSYRARRNKAANLVALPTPKTGKVATFLVFVKAAVNTIGRRLAVATTKRVRANRFRQFCRRKRVLGGICDRIIRPPQFESDERDVVVAYGAATFVSRGRFPGPVKTLRREIEKRAAAGEGPVGVSYRAVNEDYTSKLCSDCKEVLEPMLDKEHNPIHAVRRCPTTSCVRRLWNRDVNACQNIYSIFVHENSNQGSRPEKFTRAYQRAPIAAVT